MCIKLYKYTHCGYDTSKPDCVTGALAPRQPPAIRDPAQRRSPALHYGTYAARPRRSAVAASRVCIYLLHIYFEGAVADRTAKLFTNGGSQAVRLPADFRFEGLKDVYIRRDSTSNEVILSPKPIGNSWADFFALRDQAGVPPEFMAHHRRPTAPPEDHASLAKR